MIPVSRVVLGPDVEASVLAVLRSGHLVQGPVVEQLERRFAGLHHVDHAVAVSNGTVALVAALQALGIGPGDEVITSPFTFVATLNAILEVGATARFADIGDDFVVDPEAVAALVGPRTAAILPVHLYGLPADLPALSALADRHDLALVEDAAQAHLAAVQGRPVGSWGVGCFSLYATKNLTSGEGGLVTTNDPALADRLRLLRNQGMRERYRYEVAGHNYRLTDLAAAVALPQLGRLAEATERRRRNAARLREGLAGIPGLLLPPPPPPGIAHVYHQFTVRVTEDAVVDRDRFVAALAERGVGSGVYYPRVVFDYDCYREHPGVVADAVPNAARAAAQVASLPVHPHLCDEDLDTIVTAVRQVLGG